MSEKGIFYRPGELDLTKVVEPYQQAFAGWPWYEVSKCVDAQTPKRCEGGLSRTEVDESCATCLSVPTRPAYEPEELLDRFAVIEETHPARWYAESAEGKLAVVALAWLARPVQIADEKYNDVPEMQAWMQRSLPDKPIVWLDEVFADTSVRERGNLNNFGEMCGGFMEKLEAPTLAYRTISPAMIRAAERDCNVTPRVGVPDRRAFVVLEGEK